MYTVQESIFRIKFKIVVSRVEIFSNELNETNAWIQVLSLNTFHTRSTDHIQHDIYSKKHIQKQNALIWQ